jgi:Iap family predicted aminopeptidase
MAAHRKDYRSFQNGTSGKCMAYDLFDEYGIENCSIVLIENFPCESKEELYRRERYWIETMECVNKVIPIVSFEEKKEKQKKWREQNKDKLVEDKKSYYVENKEHCDKKSKEWYNNNKQKYNEYRIKNHDKLFEKIQCECGGAYIRKHKATHERSKKHQNFISPIDKDAAGNQEK